MSNTNEVNAIIESGVDAGHIRDKIICALITSGECSLNGATKAYAAYAKSTGMTSAVVSYKKDAAAWLESKYAGSGWDASAVTESVVELQEEFAVAESTARDYCKAYSEELGVVHPVANPRQQMFQYLADNKDHVDYDTLKENFKLFGLSIGRSKSNINEYWKGYDLHVFLTNA